MGEGFPSLLFSEVTSMRNTSWRWCGYKAITNFSPSKMLSIALLLKVGRNTNQQVQPCAEHLIPLELCHISPYRNFSVFIGIDQHKAEQSKGRKYVL